MLEGSNKHWLPRPEYKTNICTRVCKKNKKHNLVCACLAILIVWIPMHIGPLGSRRPTTKGCIRRVMHSSQLCSFIVMQSVTTHSLLDDVWSYNWSYDWGLMIIYLPWPWSLYKLLPCVCFLCSFFRVVFYPLNNKVIMLGVIIISSFKKFLGNEGEGYVDSTLLSYVSKSCSNRGNAMWNASSSGGSKASLNG